MFHASIVKWLSRAVAVKLSVSVVMESYRAWLICQTGTDRVFSSMGTVLVVMGYVVHVQSKSLVHIGDHESFFSPLRVGLFQGCPLTISLLVDLCSFSKNYKF